MTLLTKPELRALCYADVFDYPLTKSELSRLQIREPFTKSHRRTKQGVVKSKEGYYYIGRDSSIKKRKQHNRYSEEKTTRAIELTSVFKIIPMVSMVIVTGAVAAGNATKDDDIDCMIVTKSGWLWTARFFVVMLSEIRGVRRRPGCYHRENVLCLNMFVDEAHLGIPTREQDIFSANELAHMNIIWSKRGMEKYIWQKNKWMRKYLPNIYNPTSSIQSVSKSSKLKGINPIEWLFKNLQLLYMHRKRTSEVIKDGYVRFHPRDARKWVMKEYALRLRLVGLE